MKKILTMVLTLVMVFSTAAMAGAEWKIYGYQWLRYAFETTHYQGMEEQGGGYFMNDGTESGFNIARTYLRLKVKDKAAGYDAKVTVDIPNKKGGTKYDFGIWLKDAYVTLTKLVPIPEFSVRIGEQKTYFGTVDTWEYPVTTKALDDLLGIVGSRGQGIAGLGRIPGGWGTYELGMYNGNSYKKLENNLGKMYLGSLMLVPMAGVSIRGSYMRDATNAFDTPGMNRTASSLVLGLANGPIKSHVQYIVQSDDAAKAGGLTGVTEGISTFLSFKLTPKLALNLLWDTFNPDTGAAGDERNLYSGAIQYDINSGVQFLLNGEQIQAKYGGFGVPHETTIIAQMKWKFGKEL